MKVDEPYPRALTAKVFKDLLSILTKSDKKEKIKEISKLSGSNTKTVARWVQRKRGVPEDKLDIVAKCFGLTRQDFTDACRTESQTDASSPQATDKIQINLSEKNVVFQDDTTTTQQDIDNTISDFILTAIARMEEREAYFCNHFMETCRGKKELLKQEELLEDLEKSLEKQLHNDQHFNHKYLETKTALRAIKWVIRKASSQRDYHEWKGMLYLKKLNILINETKNIKDMTPKKFERLNWLLESVCIEYEEVCLLEEGNKKKWSYVHRIRSILMVIDFVYKISPKETLYEFFKDPDYDYYRFLLGRAYTILDEHKNDQSLSHKSDFKRIFKLMKYYKKSFSIKAV